MLYRPLHLVITQLVESSKEVEKMHQVKLATLVLFLVLAFHTFEVHGAFFPNGLKRNGYVLKKYSNININVSLPIFLCSYV